MLILLTQQRFKLVAAKLAVLIENKKSAFNIANEFTFPFFKLLFELPLNGIHFQINSNSPFNLDYYKSLTRKLLISDILATALMVKRRKSPF